MFRRNLSKPSKNVSGEFGELYIVLNNSLEVKLGDR